MAADLSHLKISREPLNRYGSLEGLIQGIRAHRLLDLNAERWRRAHPGGTFDEWREAAHRCLLEGLHYDPGPLDLRAEVLSKEDRPGFTLEHVAFNTTPWIRVEGYFLLPKNVEYPVPGLVVFHAWGGPMWFGKDRIVSQDRDHPVLRKHREKCYSGKYLADEFAKQGYAVIVIDAHHFGPRAPRGLNGIPEDADPWSWTEEEYGPMGRRLFELFYLGVKELTWAGATWMGLTYWDDSRCVDYLIGRQEVDSTRIGCTGLSGGAMRTNVMAALERRISASVSVCFMTTGDYQQVYNVAGAVGTYCHLPGVWDRLDLPDLTIMAAPSASMVISNSEDEMFPREGQLEAARQIQQGYAWAGCPEQFSHVYLPKDHCYDVELQQIAFDWFDRHLKGDKGQRDR
ncbi:MAG: hypothetical protein A3F84_19815 [Candidatus Handelsmanbacteria bacterium RIFCSPLOWO2_12_FULL_64_10]|uniref:Dienelactone hydrolase domain-containing protein n=1 Tax=Handelsmanbacteria sp. (strain RIFCSPLOWO2_12_FULL_64_10) TaxID=1817868 RepID=A0A1F6CSP4_HANXR|nr:MAG: hypothetical protein A3F84_19815 [Candidatus Handelsmanbacteria bacterium RIFCSPLOWO2_12_FULL_64_10]